MQSWRRTLTHYGHEDSKVHYSRYIASRSGQTDDETGSNDTHKPEDERGALTHSV